MDELLLMIAPYVKSITMALTAKYGIAVLILSWLGLIRLIVKPIITIFHTIAKNTKATWDDRLVEKIQNSKTLKTILFVLDWLASIKIIK